MTLFDIDGADAFGSTASKAASLRLEKHNQLLRRHGLWRASDRFEGLFFPVGAFGGDYRGRNTMQAHEFISAREKH